MPLGLLIASPQMRDPNFAGTVVLMCHHDAEGALGVVINRITSIPVEDVLNDLGLPNDARPPGERLFWGGPVEQSTGFLVTRELPIEEDEGWTFPSGLVVTTAPDRLRERLPSSAAYRLCLGCAGWGPGQLDEEIRAGGWLFTDLDEALIFERPPEAVYDLAMASLGLVASQVWMNPIDE